MKQIICTSCGASDFINESGYRICKYCGSQYDLENKTTINISNDIQRLLQKCKDEPWNARRYANLILDIDPTNKDAIKYLR